MNNVIAVGVPVIKEEISGECCPDCGCKKVFLIEVKCKDSAGSLRLSTYGGCAACGWKSQALIVPDQQLVLPNT